MLDEMSPLTRHLTLLALAVLLTWAGDEVVPWLHDRGGLSAAVGALVTAVVAVVTPLTRQYGVGADDGRHEA